jgi:ribose-phosphate pyrophosphokinase
MISVISGLNEVVYERLKFSGGEIQVRVKSTISKGEELDIDAFLFSSDDIMELVLLVDALRRAAGAHIKIRLICPYLPYARQDRVCASGESLALKVMCDIINGLDFTTVTVWDVHSDVALALLNNVFNVPQKAFVSRVKWTNTVLVAPDAGAIKKTLETAKELGLPMVRADKIRSVEDGSITGTSVYSEHIGDKDFLIVDDICDGGRTFIELAKVLRPLTNGKIYLYVTHGIFSKGLEVFDGLIDGIYTANSFPHVFRKHSLLTIV